MASPCESPDEAGFGIYQGPLHDRLAQLIEPRAASELPVARSRRLVLQPTPRLDRGVSPERELAVLSILARGAEGGETIEIAFRRKEAELLAVFAELAPLEARSLRERLSSPDPADPVACGFARLVHERRTRLLSFLADAPRRAALKR
jgi:hypothetical protein